MEFNFKKGVQVINFFAILEEKNTGKSIDKLKILKLIWIADRLHLRKYGNPIVGDTYFAMKLGPVASGIGNICDENELYLSDEAIAYIREYLQKNEYNFSSKKEIDNSLLSDSNIEILTKVFDSFGSQKSSSLVNFTHKYPEWTRFENKLNSGEIIQAEMSYLDFFENTPAQDDIFNMSQEDLETTKDIFLENQRLNNFLYNYA